jgi:hypothetical protein
VANSSESILESFRLPKNAEHIAPQAAKAMSCDLENSRISDSQWCSLGVIESHLHQPQLLVDSIF